MLFLYPNRKACSASMAAPAMISVAGAVFSGLGMCRLSMRAYRAMNKHKAAPVSTPAQRGESHHHRPSVFLAAFKANVPATANTPSAITMRLPSCRQNRLSNTPAAPMEATVSQVAAQGGASGISHTSSKAGIPATITRTVPASPADSTSRSGQRKSRRSLQPARGRQSPAIRIPAAPYRK